MFGRVGEIAPLTMKDAFRLAEDFGLLDSDVLEIARLCNGQYTIPEIARKIQRSEQDVREYKEVDEIRDRRNGLS